MHRQACPDLIQNRYQVTGMIIIKIIKILQKVMASNFLRGFINQTTSSPKKQRLKTQPDSKYQKFSNQKEQMQKQAKSYQKVDSISSTSVKKEDKQIKAFWLPIFNSERNYAKALISTKEVQEFSLIHSKSQKFIVRSVQMSQASKANENISSQKNLQASEKRKFNRLSFQLKKGCNDNNKKNEKVQIRKFQKFNFENKIIKQEADLSRLCNSCLIKLQLHEKLKKKVHNIIQSLNQLQKQYRNTVKQISKMLKEAQNQFEAHFKKISEQKVTFFQNQQINTLDQVNSFSCEKAQIKVREQYGNREKVSNSVDNLIQQLSEDIMKVIQRQLQDIQQNKLKFSQGHLIGKIVKDVKSPNNKVDKDRKFFNKIHKIHKIQSWVQQDEQLVN